MRKRMCAIILIAFVALIAMIDKVNAVGYPSSIKPNINKKNLLGEKEGWRLYRKTYSSNEKDKIFCTNFRKTVPPNGSTCTPNLKWSNDEATNKRVAAMIGAVIASVKDASGNISWDNYYYAELAINSLLYEGYTSGAGYGAKTNNLNNLPVNNGVFKKNVYNKLLAVGKYAYNNFDKTTVTISNLSYQDGVASATVTCADYAGKKINCHLTKNQVSYTVNGTESTAEASTQIATDKTVTLSATIPDGSNYTFNVTDKQCMNSAQNYSCGEKYQSVTPYDLEPACYTKDATASNSGYKLEVHKVDASDNTKFLNGATVNITKDGAEFAKDKLLIDGKFDFYGVEPGEYCVTEVKAPEGYKLNSENSCVTIDENNQSGTITLMDEAASNNLTINKVDEAGNPVAGAEIEIIDLSCTYSLIDTTDDLSSCVVDTFTTETTAKVIEGLAVGKKYRVTETKMPDGYVGGIISVEITISEDNSKNIITLTNTHSSIYVSKQSITSSKELPGAKLIITDAQGNEVANWTSTDKSQEIQGLSDGDYTLTELTAPQGYTLAESINFTIQDGKLKNDEDNTLVMKDATNVEVPDTFDIQNIIAMIAGLVLVGLGTGVLFYETKKKKA